LFGFGKAGRRVAHEVILDPRFSLEWVVRKSATDVHNYASVLLGIHQEYGRIYQASEMDAQFFKDHTVDVIIDFSHPDAVQEYAQAADLGVKIVSAISSYDEKGLALIMGLAQKTAVLNSPNITVGVNVLIMAARALQMIMPHADVEIVEEHFRDKAGVSGTAVKIANALELDPVMKISSIRVGGLVGRHEVIFALPNQTIRISHESLNRAAFGQGALFAANWLFNQPNGYYSMEQIISEFWDKGLSVY
jgi:4-hydroxy-tetrahydrodipicolinate reductase